MPPWAHGSSRGRPYDRFKSVLVNMSLGLVQDQTLWSDPNHTDRHKWWGWAGGGPQGNLGKQIHAITQKIVPRFMGRLLD